MKKKLQNDADLSQKKAKSLKLHKETLTQLESGDLQLAAGANSRSYCEATNACCQWH